MIYLTRTTVDLDGTRTTEIAALEDGAHLKRYETQGFVAASYEVYRAAWRGKHAQVYERLLVEAARPAPRLPEHVTMRCPSCRSDRVGRRNGVRYCRKCRHEWSER